MARPQVGVALAVSALLTGALAFAEPRVWPDLKVLDEVDVPDITYVGGIPVKLRQIRVKEKPEQLVQLFVDTFYAAGLWVPLGDQQPRLSQLTMLTAYDPRRRVSFTVMFQPNPDGTTTLILGESHLATKERLQAQSPVPVYPGAEDPVTVHQEGADLLTYRVLATEPELLGFYAKVLGEAGYSAGPEPQPGLFVRGREQVEVRSELQGKKRRVVVTIRSGAAVEADAPPASAEAGK